MTGLKWSVMLLGVLALVSLAWADVGDMPAPKYQVDRERSIMIPMRDGTREAANIYRPHGIDKAPVILMRNPYGKDKMKAYEAIPQFYAAQGFATVVEDVRGRWESEGKYMPQLGDAEDGYDTIQWLAKQPWSTGKVGMAGCSYLGDVQIFAAGARPPALKAILPQAAGSSIGSAGGQYKYFGARRGGAADFAGNVIWFYRLGAKYYAHLPPYMTHEEYLREIDTFKLDPTVPDIDLAKLYWKLPLNEIMSDPATPANDFNDTLWRRVTDPYWKQFPYMTDSYSSDVPGLHADSWYDFGVREVIYEFETMRKHSVSKLARDNQYLLISPSVHCMSERLTKDAKIGEMDVGDPRFDYWNMYLNWFNYWLKGEQGALANQPRVTYYLMGKNVWKTANEWPVPGTTFTKFYLHSQGRANSRYGDGALSTEKPGVEAADHYIYDPGNPVPMNGGPVLCCGGSSARQGAYDQREIEMRHDVLVYSTEPLKQGVEVTGLIDAVLFVSSDAKDTDFTVKLVDVQPDGRAFNIAEGVLRARYREGQDKEVMMENGKVYRVDVDVAATSNYFGPGHRIRIEVSSSNFPRWERNLNTGGHNYDETTWVTAANSIHHSSAEASYVLLPVVEAH